jgi:RNA polymerase sigma-32 factor
MRASMTNSSPTSLNLYLAELHRHPLLTPAEEQELARLYRDRGNARAAHLLVVSNLRFVVKVAGEFRSYGLRLADLIQEGNLGLMRAVEKFDPDRDIRLISYAVWWIRAYMQNHVLKNWSLVRIGTTQAQRKLFFALARTKRELDRLHGPSDRPVDAKELARVLKVRPVDVQQMERRLEGRDLSLDAKVNADSESTHLDAMESPELRQDDRCSAKQEAELCHAHVGAALRSLSERERFIVENRVMAEDAMSLQELGDHLGISRERARQVELRAKEKLRRALAELARELHLAAPEDASQAA